MWWPESEEGAHFKDWVWCGIRGLLVLGGVEEVPSIDENLGSVCVFVRQFGLVWILDE